MSAKGYFFHAQMRIISRCWHYASASLVMLGTAPLALAQAASWTGDSLTHNGQAYAKMQAPPALPGIGNPDQYDLYEYKQGDTAQIIAIKKGADPTKEIGDAKL